MRMFLDDMGLYSCTSRQRVSINLDAGYVVYRPSSTIGLQGKKLICVITVVVILFFISLINLTCLIWFMYKLDWSLFDRHGSRAFRINKVDNQVEFSRQVRSKEAIHTTELTHQDHMDISANNQIDIYGHEHSILFDENQILFNTDRLELKNEKLIDFNNLQSFQFDSRVNTRIHLDQFNSQHIHNRRLNLTAKHRLTISHVNDVFVYTHHLILEANQHNRRSVLQFHNYPKRRTWSDNQKIPTKGLHLKSDSIYLDIPRLPLLGNNYRSESTTGRLCICQNTFLFQRIFAHQLCPLC